MSCTKCGGTGYLLDNSYCTCEAGQLRKLEDNNINTVNPEYIPEGYGEQFEGMLLRHPYDEKLGVFLDDLHKEIITLQAIPRNYFISMMPNSGMSKFMFSILARLDPEKCVKPLSLCDIKEAIEHGTLGISNIQTAPIAFVYLEDIFPVYFRQAFDNIITKRCFVNNKTIFLSHTTWGIIVKRFPSLKNYEGNGYNKTLIIKE